MATGDAAGSGARRGGCQLLAGPFSAGLGLARPAGSREDNKSGCPPPRISGRFWRLASTRLPAAVLARANGRVGPVGAGFAVSQVPAASRDRSRGVVWLPQVGSL